MREKKPGYCVKTYKLRAYTNHEEYLKLTKEIYNAEILKYYNLLMNNIEIVNLSNLDALRELEILAKTDKETQNNDENKLPAYLRRSAINHAIGSVRSFLSRSRNAENDEEKKRVVNTSKKFECSPVYYKGIYRNLTNESIELKLWNGDNWKWYKVKIQTDERKFEIDNVMSPTLIINSKYIMIHIPVRKEVEDVTPIKERLENNGRVLSLSFSNNDKFVVCSIMNREGEFIKSKFISGGDEYKSRCARILGKIKKDRQINKKLAERDHKNYWNKLNNIGTTFAHQVSHEIIKFAKDNGAEVIVVPEVKDGDGFVARRIGKYSPYYLRHKITNYIEYKSFENSILMTKVRSNYTANRCYKCRSKVTKNGNLEYICENGHRGNYFLNSSMNIGIMGLKKYGYLNNKKNYENE